MRQPRSRPQWPQPLISVQRCPSVPPLPATRATQGPSLPQRLAAAGCATLVGLSALSGAAVASEFDLLSEPKPTTSYYVDDANVLSVSTKGDLNKKLKELEVRARGPGAPSPCISPGTAAHIMGARLRHWPPLHRTTTQPQTHTHTTHRRPPLATGWRS